MNIRNILDDLPVIKLLDKKQLKKFYAKWSITASKLIQRYAKEHSLAWYNTKWRNKLKEIPFYIRTTAPRGFLGNIWFASIHSVNYAYAKGVGKLKATRKVIPRRVRRKPVFKNGKWFTPKTYTQNFNNINLSLVEDTNINNPRYFVCKTSHNKTVKYRKPMLWYQDRDTNKVGPVQLKKTLADEIYADQEIDHLIKEAFDTAMTMISI